MKWIVAGAGALLSIAGIYGLVIGESIIQVERGWATFIAGAVAGAAGLVILAIAALIDRVDQLSSVLSGTQISPRDELPDSFPPAPPIFAPVVTQATEPDVQETRDFVPRAPMFRDAPSLRVELAPEPVVEPAPIVEPAVEAEPEKIERPAALRDFKFVFPPLDDEKPEPPSFESAPAIEPEPKQFTSLSHDEEKVEPLVPSDKPANRFNLGWLRRNKTDEPLPVRDEPAPFVVPEPAPQAEAEVIIETFEASLSPQPEPDVEPQIVPDVMPEPEPQPEPDMPPQAEWAPVPEPAPAKTPDPFSSDWLERALAGTDESEDTPPPQRFVPPSQRRALSEEAAVPAPEPVAEAEAEAVEDAPAADAPVEIGRYSANDVAYVMFSDGSITAETAAGTFRFSSLIELKDFIERSA